MNIMQRLRKSPFLIKAFNREYWGFNMVYTWVYPVWFFLCLRARSFFFFSASNPLIKNGGFLNESKKDIADIIPPELQPATVFFNAGENEENVLRTLKEKQFRFPLIGKPDTGGRGKGVKLLRSDEEVKAYVRTATVPFHIQQYITCKNEVGIFYYRYPEKAHGEISGIVRKEFLKVTGDGHSTIHELIQQHNRTIMQAKSLRNMYGPALDNVLAAGEEKELVPYGNHARGAKFLDDSHLIDDTLTRSIDLTCRRIKEFYYGRLDIRYNTWEELRQGKNFYIIEVNGAGSEPAHIYDPRHSLLFAWKEIIRHWIILWRISVRNHRRGYRYLSFQEGLQMFREDKVHSKKLATMPE